VNQKYQTTTAELEKLKSEYAAAATWQQKYESESKQWSTERDLLRAHPSMLDDEARDVARVAYERLPEASRTQPLAEWVKSIAADPSKAPRMLQPYLTSASAPAPTGAPPVVASQVPAPLAAHAAAAVAQPPQTSGPAAAPLPATVTADMLAAALEEAKRPGGSMDKFKQLAKVVQEQRRRS